MKNLTPKQTESTPRKPKTQTLPTHTIREWTLNRDDGKLYNPTGLSRIPTSEEWRAFKLLDIQWQNKQTKLKQQQEQQKQRQQRKALQQRPATTSTTATPKRKASQLDTTTETRTDTDMEKRQRTEQMDTDQVDWNSDAVKHSTIRVLADKDDQRLDQEDIQHINRLLMRAVFAECKGDMKKWRQLQPDKMSLMHPNMMIRFRLPSKEGVEFWRKFIPTIPPRSENGYRYKFLAPGEHLTEKVCFFVPDASLAENKEADLEMLAFTIRAGNEEFEDIPFKIRCSGIDKKSHKAVMIMELLTSDRTRCLGPKPDNPEVDPEWKIKIGLSTMKVTIAFAKSIAKRENAQARLANTQTIPHKDDRDKATTSPKASTSTEIEEIEMNRDEIDKALETEDEEIEGIKQINMIMIDDIEEIPTTPKATHK